MGGASPAPPLARRLGCRVRLGGRLLLLEGVLAVDYAVHLIRTTIDTMRFEPRFPGAGGAIDVLAVTPQEMRWVQRKELQGEG